MTGPIIANQVGEAFGRRIAELPSSPGVIDCYDTPCRWDIPAEADILVTCAWPEWRDAPAVAPVALPRLKWIQTYSSGVEIYPEWLKSGRIVTTGRGLTAPQIAEYVLAAILYREKALHVQGVDHPDAWQRRALGTLQGKGLGLIGFGAIGREVAARAAAFDMRIMACRRAREAADVGGVQVTPDLETVVAMADHLVLAAPLTAQTRGMLDAGLMMHMRPGAHLVNVSRGGLIDDEALLAGLERQRPAFATLDVTEPEPLPEAHPFWTHPRILLTPHLSYSGGPEAERFVDKFAQNLTAYLSGSPMIDRFDPGRGY